METFSALLAICAGKSPVPGEFPAQRPVTQSFDVCFDLRLNKRLSKQSWGWWFETQSRPLWRHSNAYPFTYTEYGWPTNYFDFKTWWLMIRHVLLIPWNNKPCCSCSRCMVLQTGRVDLPRSVGDISLNWALSSPGIEITLSSWQCPGFKIPVSLAFGKVLYINPRVYTTVAFIHILKYTPFDKSNGRLLLDEFKWNFPNLKLDVFLISPKFDGDCHYKNHHRTSADQCVSFFTSLIKRAKIMFWKFHMNPSNFSPRN